MAASHKAAGAQGEGRTPEKYRGRIRVRKGGQRDVSVELSGELDIAAADSLGEIPAWASDSGNSAAVHLSGTTFRDSSCLRELVVHQWLRPDLVALCDPSPQVRLGAAACGPEARVRFCFAAAQRDSGAPPRSREG